MNDKNKQNLSLRTSPTCWRRINSSVVCVVTDIQSIIVTMDSRMMITKKQQTKH